MREKMITKKLTLTTIIMLALAIVTSLFAVGCSQKEEETSQETSSQTDDPYAGWKTFTYQNIKIIYPPGHPLEYTLSDMAKGYITAINRNCRFFEIDVPFDTLVVYFYTGLGQGREMTGRKYPFADSNAIHFWLPSFYGPTLMQYMLPKWQNIEPKYKFLKHGLIALFDYSGQNYHKSTQGFIDEGKFIPLQKLAEDTTVDSNTERYQSAEAASFVDFLSYYFGIIGLEMLYRAQAPFDQAVEGIFQMPVDSLQNLWLDFVKERLKALDSTQTKENKKSEARNIR